MSNRLKVLIVEDEVFTAKYLSENLADLNVDALPPVPMGEQAVEVALKELPDLILMDIRLAGGMDGIEAAQAIQEHEMIPIVFMSAYAPDYITEKAKVVNYMTFLEKPIIVEQLEPILKEISEGNDSSGRG